MTDAPGKPIPSGASPFPPSARCVGMAMDESETPAEQLDESVKATSSDDIMEAPAELLTRALARIEASDRAFVDWASRQSDETNVLRARLAHQRQTGAGLASAALAMAIIKLQGK